MAEDKNCFAVDEATRLSWQLVGAYFCYFSALEGALNEALAVTYRLGGVQGSVIAGSMDFMKKLNLVGAAIGGQEKDEAWKKAATKTLNKVAQVNTNRVLMAHSILQPAEGSVRLMWKKAQDRKSRNVDETWSEERFRKECSAVIMLTKELQFMTTELKPSFTISPPTAMLQIIGMPPSARTAIRSLSTSTASLTVSGSHKS